MAKIFIIEDDVMVAALMKQALSKDSSHDLHHFQTGEECLQNLHLGPDIISIDYNLPDMNGHVLMEKIKLYNQNIMVIIVSGQANVEVVVDTYKKGAQDYI